VVTSIFAAAIAPDRIYAITVLVSGKSRVVSQNETRETSQHPFHDFARVLKRFWRAGHV
jgi:hypothetical protein